MRGGHDGNGCRGDIDAEFQAAAINVGEALAEEIGGLVGDVEIDAVGAAFLHFTVDGAGDDVARRQLRRDGACP